jgi:prepilin-type N-terminal cleavage/methylation domain-containing protein
MLTAHAAAVRNGGFTLIELAVVIFVIALLLGSLLVPLGTQTKQRNVAETQRILDETREAITGFAMATGRLPRPAVSETDGSEKTACANVAECTGYVPWAALGTARTDAWGKLIRYTVKPSLATGSIQVTDTGSKWVKTRDNGGTVAVLVNDAAAVLISHGLENWGLNPDLPDPVSDNSATNTDEDANATEDGNDTADAFWSRPAVSNTGADGGEFDDQVVWISSRVLINRMVAAGRLP